MLVLCLLLYFVVPHYAVSKEEELFLCKMINSTNIAKFLKDWSCVKVNQWYGFLSFCIYPYIILVVIGFPFLVQMAILRN
jgi:hypothetical protein